MVYLFLRGEPLGPASSSTAAPIDAVLFDKDGTLSHSEPMLLALAHARVYPELSSETAQRRW
jgi:phosphoglycolate phosphatase